MVSFGARLVTWRSVAGVQGLLVKFHLPSDILDGTLAATG